MSEFGDITAAAPADPLRPAFEALSAATTPVEKLAALKCEARKLAVPIRHGLLDFFDVEERLLDLADTHGLFDELSRGTVEVALRELKTPALRDEPRRENGHAEPPPPNGPEDYETGAARIEQPATTLPLIQSSAQFVAGFVPPDYLVDGVLQRRFIYSLTGRTGGGKTAIALTATSHVVLGRALGAHGVQQGRALYFAGENPDDIRMRWLAMSTEMGFDVETIAAHFIPGTFKISEMAERIRAEARKVGDFSLVTIDTSAAYFEGKDENSNVEQGAHARRLRGLIDLVPGGPTILVCCHPPKNAADDNLQPRGGGSFMAEMDGNLTSKKDGFTVEMHWQGKFRGPDFAPLMFQVRTATHGALKDSKGRTIPTVVAFPLSDERQQEIAAAERSNEDKLLAAVADAPRASVADLAKRVGWLTRTGEPYKSMTHRVLAGLKKAGLVKVERHELVVTDKGKTAIARGFKTQPAPNGETE